jgi:hypothetical protein
MNSLCNDATAAHPAIASTTRAAPSAIYIRRTTYAPAVPPRTAGWRLPN